MAISPKKLLLIGIDQAIPYLLKKFYNEGLIPNIGALIDGGVMAEAYSCPPCDTPTNWTTIATGATTAIHGATSFYMHIPGEPLDYGLKIRSRTSLSKYCNAEYFWDVADKNRLKSFVLNYPGGWPGNLKNGGISLLTWPLPESLPRELTLAFTMKYANDASIKSLRIKLAEEVEEDIKSLSPHLQISIVIKNKNIREFHPLKAYLIDTEGSGYNSLAIQLNKRKVWHILKIDEWSEWISRDISTIYGILPCLFKLKIKDISPDGNNLQLQFTNLYNIKGWTNPEILGERIIRNAIIYKLPRVQKVDYMISGKIPKFLSLARKEALTLANTIKFMKNYMDWDICFFHIHILDSVNHMTLGYLYEKSPLFTEKKAKKARQHIKTAYKIIDELTKLLMESCVDKETIVVLLSDHGAMPSWRVANPLPTLIRNNLLTYKLDDNNKNYILDWKKTKAFPYLEPPYIWVNLKGRDPQGIVNSNEYESVRDEIIEALYQLKDPDTGKNIINLALKKEDAEDLGQNGDRVGDVIYFLNPSYQLFDYRLEKLNPAEQPADLLKKPEAYPVQVNCAAHAYYLPNAKLGNYTVSAPLILNGPGIESGIKLNKIVNLIDVAPTLAHLLQIPKPAESQGRIIDEILS
ncbi:MAG: alkaline phosphatase family protein [Promethearchaeota archaeon]